MPTFDDYEAFENDDDVLNLPYRGKVYTIQPLGIADGARIERLRDGDESAFKGFTGQDILRLIIGPAYDDMLADNIPKPVLGRIHMTAMAFHESGAEVALTFWNRSIDPELGAAFTAAMQEMAQSKSTPNRATRRASTRSKSSGGAAKTQSRASTSTTSSQRATRQGSASTKGRKPTT